MTGLSALELHAGRACDARAERHHRLHRHLHRHPGRRRRRTHHNTATIAGLDADDTPVVEHRQHHGHRPTRSHRSASPRPRRPTAGVVAGDVVTYTFDGQNTGTSTLHNVTVTDPMTGLSAIDCTPATPGDPRPRRHHRLHRRPTRSPRPTSTPARIDNTATVDGLDPADTPGHQHRERDRDRGPDARAHHDQDGEPDVRASSPVTSITYTVDGARTPAP